MASGVHTCDFRHIVSGVLLAILCLMKTPARRITRFGGATRVGTVHLVALCGALVTGIACSGFNEDQPLPSNECPPAPTSGPTGIKALGGETHQADVPPPPLSGGTLAVFSAADATYALASIPELDRVAILRMPASGTPSVREISLERGDEPGRIVVDDSGRAHVILRGKGALVTIDPVSAVLGERRDVCPAPRGIAWHAASDALWIACSTGELVTMPAGGRTAEGRNPPKRFFVDRDLRDVVFVGDRILVSRFRSAEILSLDFSGTIQQRMSLPTVPDRLPHVAWRMTEKHGTVAVVYELASTKPIDIRRRAAVASYYNGANGTNGPPVVAAVATFSNGGFHLNQDTRLDRAAPAFDVTISDNSLIATAGPLQPVGGSVARIGISTSIGRQPTNQGQFPQIPTAVPGLQVPAMAFGDSQHLFVQTRSPAAIVVLDLDNAGAGPVIVGSFPISGVSDTGFDLFHTQTSSSVACASCHPEGGDDGHVWHFITKDIQRRNDTSCVTPGFGTPEPPNDRRTQSLRGGILPTAPFHWDGDLGAIGNVMTNVFTNGMSGGDVSSAQSAIVARWLNAIPRVPARVDLDAARVAAGRALFEGKGGCSTCHAGSMLTNNTTVNIGKGDPLQVPNLIGVGDRAPFLHDGCAKTLADRFDPSCGGSQHGNPLEASEQADVVQYLESL
jgi:hypothetical protein